MAMFQNQKMLLKLKSRFAITLPLTDRTIYLTVTTLSIQDHLKLLQQLKSGFK